MHQEAGLLCLSCTAMTGFWGNPGERAGLPQISLATHSFTQYWPVCGWLFITEQS